MRMIGCVSPVTEGKLRVLGLDPAVDGPAIRARLGVVPQDDNLDMELTVAENLLIYGRFFDLPKSVIRPRIDELLDFVQLTERRDDRVEPLSGGMKRRLTIARSLINEPTCCCSTSPRPGSTRKRAMCCGTGCIASSNAASRSCSRRTTWTKPNSSAIAWS